MCVCVCVCVCVVVVVVVVVVFFFCFFLFLCFFVCLLVCSSAAVFILILCSYKKSGPLLSSSLSLFLPRSCSPSVHR